MNNNDMITYNHKNQICFLNLLMKIDYYNITCGMHVILTHTYFENH